MIVRFFFGNASELNCGWSAGRPACRGGLNIGLALESTLGTRRERICVFVLIIKRRICLGLRAAGSVGQLVPCMDFGTFQCGFAWVFPGLNGLRSSWIGLDF